jgi:cytochrome o ubiquinol oxidase subunit 2
MKNPMPAKSFSLMCRPPPGQTLQRYFARPALALVACGTAGCSSVNLGFLAPAGVIAAAQRELFLWVVGLALVVVLPVIVLTPWLLWRYRYGQQHAAYRPRWDFSLPLEILTWGVPVAVVAVLAVLTWQRSQQLDPYRPLPGPAATLEIQVIALDWNWLFIYPQQGVASLNELVIAQGTPVHLSLTSATVMQALLIPRLAGQIYAMAGMRTQQYLQADAAGHFLGRNTQFNGNGFQTQVFTALAMTPQGFDDWLNEVRRSPKRLDCRPLSQGGVQPNVQHYGWVERGLFEQVMQSFSQPGHRGCHAFSQERAHE